MLIGARRRLRAGPVYLVLGVLVVFALGPLVVIFFNALKGPDEIGRNPLGLPADPIWSNFADAWTRGGFATTTVNSLILVVGTVTAVLILGGAGAYSLARLRPPGHDAFVVYVLLISTLPLQLFLVPLFFLWKSLGLVNTLPGVMIIYTAVNLPLAVLLLRSYLVQLPREFDDAARVDGAGEWQVMWKVVIPLAWPGFLTVGLVVALAVWNEFLIASVFLTNPKLFTVVTSYLSFTSRFSADWGLTSAAAVMMVMPLVLIFLALQRRFIAGLTAGGLNA